MVSNRQLFLRHMAQTSPSPLFLEIESSHGIFLKDTGDKDYMDLISGIGVSVLGHSYPAVVEAVKKQAEQYMHTLVYGEYVLAPQVNLANLLTSQLPDTLDSVYFVNSGAEAVEGGLKLAKRYTGRHEIIACRNAYHGSTQGAASLMSPQTFNRAFAPLLPGIRHISFNNTEDLDKITENTACVIMEPIQAEAGVISPVPGYLEAVRRRCDETGTLLIFDEVQTAYGRTGSLFAFQKYRVTPDILLLAKGFGGGMPLGAFIASRNIMQTLTHDPVLGHITTFGGHPVSCAAALATLEVLLSNTHLVEGVPGKENLFISMLQHESIRELRHDGLWLAMDLGTFSNVQKLIQYGLGQGLITDWFLFNDHSVRIAPPLIIQPDEIKHACEILLKGLDLL